MPTALPAPSRSQMSNYPGTLAPLASSIGEIDKLLVHDVRVRNG